MHDLIMSANKSLHLLRGAIDKRYEVAAERAEAERDYRTTLGREMAEQRVNGMAATALYDYCRGLPDIAEKRMRRDILLAQEDHLTELIYYYRTTIRLLEGQINAERKSL